MTSGKKSLFHQQANQRGNTRVHNFDLHLSGLFSNSSDGCEKLKKLTCRVKLSLSQSSLNAGRNANVVVRFSFVQALKCYSKGISMS